MVNVEISDEKIVTLILEGDINKFEQIVLRYEKLIFNIGMRLFKNEDESYDFSQELFLKVYNKLSTYKGLAPFKNWIVRFAYNHGINMLKGKKNESELQEYEKPSDERTPEQNYMISEIKQVLSDEINKLPDKYRICLDLYFFSNFSYAEIKEITSIPVNTIKSHVLRAKNQLRKTLEGTIAEDYNEMR